MAVGGHSAWLKVGPNYAESNHEPGRGQIEDFLKKELKPAKYRGI